jgi:ribonuclease HI
MKPKATIYTDGGCVPNPGNGGWGAIIIDENGQEIELSGSEKDTTNNRMELTAVMSALQSLTTPHEISMYVDSEYVKKGLNEWMDGWLKKNWRNSKGEAVKNQDLWERLNILVKKHEIHWHWVKGHAGNIYNERVDRLAAAAIPGAKPRPEKATITMTEAAEGTLSVYFRVVVPKNGGPGGWAIRVWDGEKSQDFSGRVPAVESSNKLELMIASQIFKTVPKDATLRIYCNSEYIFKGMTQWIGGWQKRNWTKADGAPVKYADIWREIQKYTQGRQVEWVMEQGVIKPIEGLEKVAQAALNN